MVEDALMIPEDIRIFLDNTRHGIAVVKDGNIVYANPKVVQYTGYIHEELIGMNILNLTEEDQYETVIDAMERLMENPEKENPIEIPIVKKEGSYRNLRIDGSIVNYQDEEMILISAMDLTDKLDAIERMKSIEEKYISVLEHSPNNIYLVDMETMNIIESNSTLQNLLGYNEEELLNMKPYDFIAHEHEDVNDEVKRLPNGEYGFVGQRKYRAKDGRIIDVEVSANVINYRGRKTISVVSWDITNIKKVQEEMVHLNEVLQLVSRITRHDIRNKLTIAYGILGLMLEQHSFDETFIKEAYKAVTNAIDITKRMTDLETLSLSGNEMKKESLKDIIEDAIIDHPVKYSIKGNATAYIDSAFGSVIENLIGNAIKHGEATRVKIEIEEDSENILIRIEDNGKGINRKVKDKVFHESVSYGDNKGTGLGLYIVKKVIERYGGKVWLEKTSEEGSVFIIQLAKNDDMEQKD